MDTLRWASRPTNTRVKRDKHFQNELAPFALHYDAHFMWSLRWLIAQSRRYRLIRL
jgi:hypothetical protein